MAVYKVNNNKKIFYFNNKYTVQEAGNTYINKGNKNLR